MLCSSREQVRGTGRDREQGAILCDSDENASRGYTVATPPLVMRNGRHTGHMQNPGHHSRERTQHACILYGVMGDLGKIHIW